MLASENLLKLELDIANNNVLKESVRAQIGITDNFMGDIGTDFSKPLKFLFLVVSLNLLLS
jgi:hypothetical protein